MRILATGILGGGGGPRKNMRQPPFGYHYHDERTGYFPAGRHATALASQQSFKAALFDPIPFGERSVSSVHVSLRNQCPTCFIYFSLSTFDAVQHMWKTTGSFLRSANSFMSPLLWWKTCPCGNVSLLKTSARTPNVAAC